MKLSTIKNSIESNMDEILYRLDQIARYNITQGLTEEEAGYVAGYISILRSRVVTTKELL